MDSKFVYPTHVCAVDIGGTKIACGIVTLNGTDAPNVQSVKKVPTNAKEGGKQVLATVLQAIREALARAEELDLTISGVVFLLLVLLTLVRVTSPMQMSLCLAGAEPLLALQLLVSLVFRAAFLMTFMLMLWAKLVTVLVTAKIAF